MLLSNTISKYIQNRGSQCGLGNTAYPSLYTGECARFCTPCPRLGIFTVSSLPWNGPLCIGRTLFCFCVKHLGWRDDL